MGFFAIFVVSSVERDGGSSDLDRTRVRDAIQFKEVLMWRLSLISFVMKSDSLQKAETVDPTATTRHTMRRTVTMKRNLSPIAQRFALRSLKLFRTENVQFFDH